MDGSDRQTLHNTSLTWPNALTLDIQTQVLYWADANLDRIESSNTDGTNRQLLTTTGIFHPFAMTSFDGAVYWTDWQLDAILVWKLDNVTILFDELPTEPMGIQVLSPDRQPPGNVLVFSTWFLLL